MKRYTYILILVSLALVGCPAYADDNNGNLKAKADSAYVHEKYDKALEAYMSMPGKENSVDLCYNIGCCYYRLDDIANSILWFERAYLLNPGDEDVCTNLEMARSKTIDKIVSRHEFILISIFRSLVNAMSLRLWAVTALTLFVACLLSFCLYFFTDRMFLRKLGFFMAVFFFILTIGANVCAFQQRQFSINRNTAIIMSPSVTVKSTPSDSGNDLFVIHEGTRIEITDNSLKDWCEIRIVDGKVGWIRKKNFTVI